ncbi:hypothetical protein DSL64_26685 [Dyadobacter luteus]|uniref:Reverse transcriptase n=1 Tax=Dyadobacter luteus TaxID=2259619 RepID=A0A3D8Y399_9BACT|nr:hypothetical protein DSL64_26685 [Dyadobacter luteus]
MVWDSYLWIKANKSSAGSDRQTMDDFEKDLRENLYKIWNRLTSGSYFTPAVGRVDLPKGNGKT